MFEVFGFSYLYASFASVALYLLLWKNRSKELDPSKKVVVITGCDRGIGFELAQRVKSWGFCVVAFCLNTNSDGAKRLSSMKIHTLPLDLGEKESILKAVSDLPAILDDKELFCVVNNAGVMVYGLFQWLSFELISHQVQINVVGTAFFTKCIMELMESTAARVVFVSSPQAFVPCPYVSLYAGTKASLEALSQGIRREVSPKIKICVVRPCSLPVQTGIMASSAKQLQEMKDDMSADLLNQYEEKIDELIDTFSKTFSSNQNAVNVLDESLFLAFRHAIMEENPRHEYMATSRFIQMMLCIFQHLPTSFMDYLFKYNIPMRIIAMHHSK